MLILYNILYIIFALCYLPIFLIKRKYHHGFLMRLGIFPAALLERIKQKRIIWLHTVSVGEASAQAALIKNLRQQYPDFRLLLSTVTVTGNKIARNLIADDELSIYSPLDIGLIVRGAIDLIQPELAIIAETEIWPNLILALAERDVPVVLVNGRISEGSFKGYRIIRPFLANILRKFSLFCMQTQDDARRIISLGAEVAKVRVTGNMKFDLERSPELNQRPVLGLSVDERLFIAGSTHRGEEKIVLQVYRELTNDYRNLRLLIAPRHIERVAEIEKLASRFGFNTQRFSQFNHRSPFTVYRSPIVLVLDTVGQLRSLYALAEIVFIGGSLIPHGGQNPIEPAGLGRAIIFGPYMHNFSAVAELFLNRRAAIMVKDPAQFKEACSKLLADLSLRQELGARAKQIVRQNKGASRRVAQLIKEVTNGRWVDEG